MLISHLPVNRCLFNRKYSRIKRLILFRMAAHPIFLVTVMPSLVVSDFPGPTTAIKCSFLSFRPFSDSLTNSVRLRILADFLKRYLLNQISRDRLVALFVAGSNRLLHPYFKRSALCCRSPLHSEFYKLLSVLFKRIIFFSPWLFACLLLFYPVLSTFFF